MFLAFAPSLPVGRACTSTANLTRSGEGDDLLLLTLEYLRKAGLRLGSGEGDDVLLVMMEFLRKAGLRLGMPEFVA